ncbi:MAG: DUF342 domain-containing protein [Desulfamplus sp.]|nr:DUF342 domain-containing protein [Desulfamplus sp.]
MTDTENMGNQKIILIVDDQKLILKALEKMLSSQHKHKVVSALNGLEALDIVANRKDEDDIFLVISDNRMPQMTGIQMFESIMELLPDSIRVLMSGYADKEIIAAAVNQGVIHRFINKPWNMDELNIIVRYADESPEKFRDSTYSCTSLKSFTSNIMQKEIDKFSESRNDTYLGKIAIQHGFITRRQLEAAISTTQSARQAGKIVSLENILFEKGLISSEDMGKLIAVARRRSAKDFAKLILKDFGVSIKDINRCLAIQAKEFSETSVCRMLGDILVDEKILTEELRESAIINAIYSEREEILKSDPNDSSDRMEKDSVLNEKDHKIILNTKKKNFFKQRAVDKLFCKIAIDKNFVTEPEVLQILEEQLIGFSKNFEIKKIRDIMIEHSIISEAQAALIDSLITVKPVSNEDGQKEGKKRVFKIGENNAFELTVTEDEMEAAIRVVGKMPEGMTAESLKYLLKAHQIIYGLVDDIDIELFLKRASEPNRPFFIIAKGRPVKLGRDASIKYFFEDENSRFGRELASGKFDYRDRGEINNVAQGTVLAQKIPLIEPVKGSTVTGMEIPAHILVDVNLSCGKGAVISKDGLTVTAEVNGRPNLALGGKISVVHEKTVEGNVDFKTGNIIFGGDVNVTGTLLPGFSVIADNLTVNDIEDGEVNVENNIIVKNNITNANIRSGGNLLVAQSIKKSTISARGDVVIEKEIIDCTIITSGSVLISRGRIVASTIHAAKGIEAKYIGSEKSSPCNLFPGADDHSRDAVKKFNEQIESQKKRLEELQSAQKEWDKKIFEQLNALTELSKIQEGMLAEKENALDGKANAASDIVKNHINERIVDIENRISKTGETINRLFYEHEKSLIKSKSIQVNINAVTMKTHELMKEKNEFQKWYDNQQKDQLKKKEIAGVVVHGTLFAGTYIKTTQCAMKAANDIKSSKIYQVLNNSNPASPFYEIKIDSMSSSRRGH